MEMLRIVCVMRGCNGSIQLNFVCSDKNLFWYEKWKINIGLGEIFDDK